MARGGGRKHVGKDEARGAGAAARAHWGVICGNNLDKRESPLIFTIVGTQRLLNKKKSKCSVNVHSKQERRKEQKLIFSLSLRNKL